MTIPLGPTGEIFFEKCLLNKKCLLKCLLDFEISCVKTRHGMSFRKNNNDGSRDLEGSIPGRKKAEI